MSETAQWITFASVILGFLFQYLNQLRQRRWDKEDREYHAAKEKAEREETAAKLAETATAEAERVSTKMIDEARSVADRVVSEAKRVADMVISEAAQVAAKAATDRARLAKAIEVNTVIATQARESAQSAYAEANTVNQKIEKLGLDHNALQREKQEGSDKSEATHEAVLDTQERVVRIETEVVKDKDEARDPK